MAKVLAVLVFLALGFSSATAQVRYSVDKFYSAKEACLAGPRNFYESVYKNDAWKNPVGGNIVKAPLESDACVHLHVVGGYAWVWQHAGEEYRWRRNVDGTLSILSRDDCGNMAYGIAYPSPTPGPVANPPVGVTKGNPPRQVIIVNVNQTMPAANRRAPPPSSPGFWCFRGFGQGFTCLTLLAGAVVGVHELVKRDDKPEPPPHQGPGVKSDSSKTTCTGLPCTGGGPPTVSPLRSGNNGLMFNPANGSVGWRFSLPRR